MGDRPPTKQELIAEVQELRRRLQAAEAALQDREKGISIYQDSIREMERERQDLAAELSAQAEELEIANEELTVQAEELRIQNEELQALNLRLEVQNEELERVAEELQAERALLRTVLEQMPAGVIIAAAPSGEFLLVNRQMTEILGRSMSVGDSQKIYTHFQTIHPDGRLLQPDEYPLAQALSRGRTVTEQELEIIREDGALRTLRVSAAPIRDRLGRIIAGAATYHDITARKAAQAEIRRMASFPQLNPSPVLEMDLFGRITYYNQAARTALQSLGGAAGPEAFLPEDLEDILTAIRELGARRFYREVRINDAVFAEDISYAEPLEVIRIYARDITERQQAEETLVRAKQEWELTFDAVPDLIAIIDTNHRLVRVNRPMAAALGVEPRDLVGRPCHEIMHSSSGPPPFCPHSRLLTDGREHVAEVHELGRDFLVSASPLTDAQGNLLGSVHVARDITERKQTEEALRQSEAQLQTILENLTEGLVVATLDGQLFHWNRAAIKMHGFASLDECRRRLPEFADIFELSTLDGAVLPLEQWPLPRILRGETLRNLEVRLRRLQGDWQGVFNYGGALVRDESGQPLLAVVTVTDITERKASEQALRESEARERARVVELQAILDTTPGFIWLAEDPECRIISGNRAAYELLRRQPGSNLSKSASEGERPENFRAMRDGREIPVAELPVQRAAAGETVRDYEFDLVFTDGAVRHLMGNAVPLSDDAGRPRGAVAVFMDLTVRKQAQEALERAHDELEQRVQERTADLRLTVAQLHEEVTERQRAENALQAERQRLFDLLEELPAYVCLLKPDYSMPFANRYFRERFGESKGRPCYEFLFGREIPCENCQTFKVLETNTPQQWEWTGPDGCIYQIYDRLIADADGSPMILEMGIDISARKEAETGLRESEARFRATFDQSPVGVVVADLDFRFQQVNPAFCRITGYTAEELSSMTVTDIVHPDDLPRGMEKMQRFIAGEIDAFRLEERNIRKDGAVIWVDASADLIRDSQGHTSYYIAIIQDITARKEAEEALAEHADRLQDLYNNAPCGYHSLDPDGAFVQINDTELNWLGYTRDEVLGKMKFSDLLTADSLEIFRQSFPAFKERGWGRDLEFNMVRKDGTVMPVLVNATAITDAAGNYLMSRSTVFDITAHKETDRLIRQQNALLNGINRIFREGLTCKTEADLGRVAITVLEGLTGAGIGLIYDLNPEGSLDIIAISDSGREACQMAAAAGLELPRHLPVRGLYRRVVQEGKSLIANQPASHPDSIGVPEGHAPLTEFLGVPLKHGDQITGVICLANKDSGFNAADQEVAETLAIAAAEALTRFRAEKQAVNLGRLYRVLSQVNETIVRAPDRETLFEQICRIAVEEGLFHMAWIGLVDHEEGLIKAVAQHGLDEGYLERLKIPLEDAPESRGPTGTAVREGRYDVCNDFANDPRMAPWRQEALARGYRSSGSFPLQVDGQVMGAITMYAGEAGFFTAEEISLLESLAQDVSFAMASMEREARRRQAEEALKESEEKLRYLASQLIGAQEAERKRISLELHDDLGQSLTLLKLQLRGIDQNLPADWGDLRERCADLRTNLDELIEKVRSISRDLSPTMVIDLGLPTALRNLTEEFAKYHEIKLSLEMDEVQLLFTAEEEVNLYRIFQESLNNIAKHAQASRIDITIKQHKGRVTFSVADNGAGFDVQRTLTGEVQRQGLGLAAMEERVRMLGGTLKISSHKGRGTKISFVVPVRRQEP